MVNRFAELNEQRQDSFLQCTMNPQPPEQNASGENSIMRVETGFRIIELNRESSGLLSVSALDKFDMFSGEYGLVLTTEEGKCEVEKYVKEDVARTQLRTLIERSPTSAQDERRGKLVELGIIWTNNKWQIIVYARVHPDMNNSYDVEVFTMDYESCDAYHNLEADVVSLVVDTFISIYSAMDPS